MITNLNVSGPKHYDDMTPLEKNNVFSFKECVLEKNEKNTSFIQALSEQCTSDIDQHQKGEGRIFFQLEDAYLEIDIKMNDKIIEIKPYLYYNSKTIKTNIHKIMKKEYELFKLFKQENLQ